MADKQERTKPGIELPDEERGDEPTGGARQFKRAATIAAGTRDDVATALEPESLDTGKRVIVPDVSEQLASATDNARTATKLLKRARGEPTGQQQLERPEQDEKAVKEPGSAEKKTPAEKIKDIFKGIFGNTDDTGKGTGK